MLSIFNLTLSAFNARDPQEKIDAIFAMKSSWDRDMFIGDPVEKIPLNAGHPASPKLVPPSDVPRRRLGSLEGRAALLHAVAHIEFNAMNLATDMVLRFGNSDIFEDHQDQSAFITDWIKVAHDEARHFTLLRDYLVDLEYNYGFFPAHNGLWEAAQNTAHDIASRLAIAPLVLEARGLDVTPPMIEKFRKHDDQRSVEILSLIYEEEISHVAFGTKWFQYVAEKRGKESKEYFHDQVRGYFKGKLKRPFNEIARLQAGLEQEYYLPLCDELGFR